MARRGTKSGARLCAWMTGLLFGAIALGGCSKGENAAAGPGFGGPLGTGGMEEGDDDDDDDDDDAEGGACLKNNCTEDLECAGCEEGANLCDTDQGRCVQCDPESGTGCDDGETCTEFGNCVPQGQDCPTADGLPNIECNEDADCAACDPDHQVCNTETKECVSCTADNQGSCQSVEHCSADGECVSNCPESCDSDADCGQCGGDGHEAHACNAHQCTQCSDTVPCQGGQICNEHGACVDFCGIPGQVAGTCDDDGDCAGCPGDTTNCVSPINGGHGTCGAEASGCSDLGEGVAVLPDPFDQVTNLCSDDGDCNGIGVQFNVGKLLRDITGLDAIDDANINYPMNECANATVSVGASSISCGICVPCKEDDDCEDIDVDEVAADAFGPLGAIASAILLDQLFGQNDHTIHMFCQPVAGDYGACLPCPSLLSDCAGPGPGSVNGDCDHDTCTEGEPLGSNCGSCAAAICEHDSYCCTTEWDHLCVGHVETQCAGSCDGSNGGSCSHNPCSTGDPLSAACSSCVDTVCDDDPYCCQTSWDDICVGQAEDVASCNCDGGGSDCAHDECELGGPLTEGCSACAQEVCDADDYCCTTDWDVYCTDAAEDIAACNC